MQNTVHRILVTCGQKREDLEDSTTIAPPQKQNQSYGMRVNLTEKKLLNTLFTPKYQIRQIKNFLLSVCYLLHARRISCLRYLQLLFWGISQTVLVCAQKMLVCLNGN